MNDVFYNSSHHLRFTTCSNKKPFFFCFCFILHISRCWYNYRRLYLMQPAYLLRIMYVKFSEKKTRSINSPFFFCFYSFSYLKAATQYIYMYSLYVYSNKSRSSRSSYYCLETCYYDFSFFFWKERWAKKKRLGQYSFVFWFLLLLLLFLKIFSFASGFSVVVSRNFSLPRFAFFYFFFSFLMNIKPITLHFMYIYVHP